MVVVKLLLLASILFLQGASHCSPLPVKENAPTEITAIERDFFRWVKHMGYYERYYRYELHKAEKKKDKNKKSSRTYKKEKELKPCKRIIKVNNNQNQYDPQAAASAGQFVSVQEAISSIPVVNKCRVVVYISAGIYKEKVEVPTTMGHITIKGQGADKTVIEWDDTAAKVGKSGKPLGTFASATFAVNSVNFIAKNITFKNATPPPPSGALGKQAVAMRVSADMAAFVGCKFIGAQDTLYDHTGRHYFRECYIEGSIDFVFGNGRSLYQDCHLHAVTNSYGALTAQKRQSLLEETGFAFVKCKVTGGSGVFYLGRAWGPFSRVVFAYTYMDKIIAPRGWNDWGDKNRQMTVFYGQYKCWGPGAEYGGRVAWSRELTYEEARPFISIDFIDGYEWLKNSLYSN